MGHYKGRRLFPGANDRDCSVPGATHRLHESVWTTSPWLPARLQSLPFMPSSSKARRPVQQAVELIGNYACRNQPTVSVARSE